MPATVATLFFALLIAGLFRLDRDPEAGSSSALWLPVAWMFIGASRMVSQWFRTVDNTVGSSAFGTVEYIDGSPSDRVLLALLLAIALAVLVARRDKTSALLRANLPILVFFLYCAISVLWSDFPMVAFKRWTKALGNITMVLVILTDANPASAVKRAFARTGFLLIPLSVMVIKYFPDIGRIYSRWTWTSTNTGVATDKNGLGALAMVFGLAFLWLFLEAWRDRDTPARGERLLAYGATLAMALWLFAKADSTTALLCVALGAFVLLITMLPGRNRRARLGLITATLFVTPFLAFVFQDFYTLVVEGLGRNTTLTGRTALWSDLLSVNINPVLGTGFESFWLGPRGEYFWNRYYFHPNQAHNGYIETYINLGGIGVGLLLIVLLTGYWNVVALNRRDPDAAGFRLTMLLVGLMYNVTEAAFKVMNPLWIAFLLAAAVPLSVPAVEDATERPNAPRRSLATMRFGPPESIAIPETP